jgi:hypothetical protein
MSLLTIACIIVLFAAFVIWLQELKPKKRNWMVCPVCHGMATGEHICHYCDGKGWIYK